MRRVYKFIFIVLLSVCMGSVSAQSRKDFVNRYKYIAISEMERTGIPASIKLGQGILESGCGVSDLSQKAHNHFGIKCHSWEGESFHMDDDEANECFRKYNNPEQSWIDHSEFLTSRPRYAELFKLKTTDYKGWARGLKSCGYATNPRYADLLIKIIEEEELYKFDRDIERPTGGKPANVDKTPVLADKGVAEGSRGFKKREEMRNGILCIELRKGDTYESVAEYYGIKLKKLLAYNDKTDSSVKEGDVVYLKRKKSRAARGYEFHRVKEGDSLFSISQTYGVRLKNVCRYNYLENGAKLTEGEKIYLRSKAELY